MVIIISISFASQKMLDAAVEVLADADSSVLTVNIGTEAGIQDW